MKKSINFIIILLIFELSTILFAQEPFFENNSSFPKFNESLLSWSKRTNNQEIECSKSIESHQTVTVCKKNKKLLFTSTSYISHNNKIAESNLLKKIYYNSSIFILTLFEDIPLPELIIMYLFFYGNLLLTIIGIYIILCSKKFFPPVYFDIEDVLRSEEYGFSGLIRLLSGSFFLFPLYSWYFCFTLLSLLLLWWIYKKMMRG